MAAAMTIAMMILTAVGAAGASIDQPIAYPVSVGGDPVGSVITIPPPSGIPAAEILTLHSEWLRERCTSPESVDQETFQMLLNPHEYQVPLVTNASAIRYRDDPARDILKVHYEDGHRSDFRIAELAKELAGDLVPVQVLEQEEVLPRLWNATSLGPVPKIHFNALRSDDTERLRALRHLLEEGILLVQGVPKAEGQCVEMADFFSTLRSTEWGKEFNVKPAPDGDKKDLAYGGSAIGMHTDNCYRDPTPSFQLLHAIRHCECDPEKDDPRHVVVDGKNCSACTVFNTFTDGFFVADKLSREDPRAFELLSSVPVRFENNGGDNSSFLNFQVPHFQLHQHADIIRKKNNKHGGRCGAECVRSIRFSSKSGGYAPPLDPAILSEFYRAKRLFSTLVHDPPQNVFLQLAPGDMIIFDNERLLHARSSIAHSDGDRFLQGCYFNRDGIVLDHERLRRRVEALRSNQHADIRKGPGEEL